MEQVMNSNDVIAEVSRHLMTNNPREIRNYIRNFMEIDVSLQTVMNFFIRSEEEEDIRSQMNIYNYYESKDIF